MASVDIENSICEAIEYIVNHAIDNAKYDKTIQAKIVSCIDQTIGKYKVKYQDSTFFAYSNNIDVKYSKNTDVYILIPGNDMSKEKTILGTTKKLGINYISEIEEENKYDIIGNNCVVNSREEFNLCSYKTTKKEIYNYKNSNNELNININDINSYIKNYSSVLFDATFQTKLASEQQFKGNYGIIYELAFLDKINNTEITKNYMLDVNQMSGEPYRFTNEVRQYVIFDIDNINFIRINSISIFCYNFPNQKDGMANDIMISNFGIYAVEEINEKEINSTMISFITPKGNYFDNNDKDPEKSNREIQAIVKVRGKQIDNDSQKVDYYWFKENLKITSDSDIPGYNQYGGPRMGMLKYI